MNNFIKPKIEALAKGLLSTLEITELKELAILEALEKAYLIGREVALASPQIKNNPANKFPIESCVGVGKDDKLWYAFKSTTKGKEVTWRESYPDNMYFHAAVQRCHILLDEIEAEGIDK